MNTIIQPDSGDGIPFVSPVSEAVRHWEDRLRISLRENQSRFAHHGDRGEGNEAAFREFLRAHLSPKYRIGQGEVIDYSGNRSNQTDVAVVDEEQPFYVGDAPQLLIIEGVSAAAEVKTTLTAADLRDCINKGRNYKKLDAILGKSIMLCDSSVRGRPNSDRLRYYKKRPFFVFAYRSRLKPDTLSKLLADSARSDEVPPIDAVFVLDKGFAMNFWDGNGQISLTDPESGQVQTGWVWWNDASLVLTYLLFWLHSSMPRFAIRSSPMMAYLLPGTKWIERVSGVEEATQTSIYPQK